MELELAHSSRRATSRTAAKVPRAPRHPTRARTDSSRLRHLYYGAGASRRELRRRLAK